MTDTTPAPAPANDDIVVQARRETGQYGTITEATRPYIGLDEPTLKHMDLKHADTTINGQKKVDGAPAVDTFTGYVKDGAELTLNNTHLAQIGVAPNAKATIAMNGTADNDFFQVYDKDRDQKTGTANVTINGNGGTDTVAITNVPPDQVIVTGVAGNPNEVRVKAGTNEYTLDNITYLKERPGSIASTPWDQSKHYGPPLPENTHGANIQEAGMPGNPLADGKSATLAQLLRQYDMSVVEKTRQYNLENGICRPQPSNDDVGKLSPKACGQRPERAGPDIPG